MKRSVAGPLAVLAGIVLYSSAALCENAAAPGKLIEEHPTLKCLGVRWYIAGDANSDAKIELRYRKVGEADWKRALDLFKTGPNWAPGKAPAEGESLFAGSVFGLDEGTEYELQLKLVDPDGGGAEKVLKMKTRAEPRFDKPLRTLHVAPGGGGGSGTAADPFKGLDAAQAAAAPGDLFLVHKGSYKAPWVVTKSGEEGKPVVWRGAGEALIEGGDPRPSNGITACGIHDVWFEGLSITKTVFALVGHNSARVVVRRCKLYDNEYGVTSTKYSDAQPCVDWFIADNTMTGPSVWPREKGIEDARGVQVGGLGHVVCYNFVRGFADAIDVFQGPEASAMDIYGNEVTVLTDDGFECDNGQFNVRCFSNRMTNVFQGISTQPTYAGPIYIFRNVMLNVGMESFKMHNNPSGALFFHNTCVKTGMPLVMNSGKPIENCVSRNNIFIGTTANYVYENTAPAKGCDYDYDGFGSDGDSKMFMKWNGKKYASADELKAGGDAYKNVVVLDPAKTFAKGDMRPKAVETELKMEENDLRLVEGSAAVDAGAVLFNVNDGFKRKAPDLGAYELGEALPHYGPRPEKK